MMEVREGKEIFCKSRTEKGGKKIGQKRIEMQNRRRENEGKDLWMEMRKEVMKAGKNSEGNAKESNRRRKRRKMANGGEKKRRSWKRERKE